MAKLEFERIGPAREQLGESPVWDPETESLFWVDSRRGIIRRYRPATRRLSSWTLPAEIGSIALAGRDRLLAAIRNGFWLVDLPSGDIELVAQPFADGGALRFNDGKMDRQGRFLCGTMALHSDTNYDGALFQLSGGAVRKLESGIRIANSTCFSPRGDRLYFADSLAHCIWSYDYDVASGDISNKAVLVDTRAQNSVPDGATVDADGCLWVALIQAGALARYTPAGALDRLVPMPVPMPTCPAFGGKGLETLYVTSISDSGTGRSKSDHPDAGATFALHGLGVSGLAETPYRFKG